MLVSDRTRVRCARSFSAPLHHCMPLQQSFVVKCRVVQDGRGSVAATASTQRRARTKNRRASRNAADTQCGASWRYQGTRRHAQSMEASRRVCVSGAGSLSAPRRGQAGSLPPQLGGRSLACPRPREAATRTRTRRVALRARAVPCRQALPHAGTSLWSRSVSLLRWRRIERDNW